MLISINVKMESVHGINNKHFFSFCVWIRLIWLNFSLRTKHVALCSILSKTEIVQLFASTLRDFFYKLLHLVLYNWSTGSYLRETCVNYEVFMWFRLCIHWETLVSLWFPFGNLGFPYGLPLSSIWGNH